MALVVWKNFKRGLTLCGGSFWANLFMEFLPFEPFYSFKPKKLCKCIKLSFYSQKSNSTKHDISKNQKSADVSISDLHNWFQWKAYHSNVSLKWWKTLVGPPAERKIEKTIFPDNRGHKLLPIGNKSVQFCGTTSKENAFKIYYKSLEIHLWDSSIKLKT